MRGSEIILLAFWTLTRASSASRAVNMYHGCMFSISSVKIALGREGGEEEGGRGREGGEEEGGREGKRREGGEGGRGRGGRGREGGGGREGGRV